MRGFVSIFAVLGVVSVEVVALLQGIDGVALAASVGALSAIAGYWRGTKCRETSEN